MLCSIIPVHTSIKYSNHLMDPLHNIQTTETTVEHKNQHPTHDLVHKLDNVTSSRKYVNLAYDVLMRTFKWTRPRKCSRLILQKVIFNVLIAETELPLATALPGRDENVRIHFLRFTSFRKLYSCFLLRTGVKTHYELTEIYPQDDVNYPCSSSPRH